MNALVIFAKYPVPGAVKRRIGREIGMEKSAELCECFIKDLYEKNSNQDYDLYLSFIGKEHKEQYRGRFPDAILYVQRGHTKGENLSLTFEDLLDDYEKVVIIGCDAPQVGPALIKAAFKALESHDVVIGPASDGGYYLIGIKKNLPFLNDLPWGTPELLDQTIKRLKERKESYVFIDELEDIDDLEELKAAKKRIKESDAPATFKFLQRLDV